MFFSSTDFNVLRSFSRQERPRDLLENRLHVGNLLPTVDECISHTNPLQSWQTVAARLPLSQVGPIARQAPWVAFVEYEYAGKAVSASATPLSILAQTPALESTGMC
jgi:hypothetical protein